MNDELERRLREVLRQEARRITPHDRRMEILAMAHNDSQKVGPARRWLIPVAAAASVALIGVVAWGVSNGGGNQQVAPVVGHKATSTTTSSPSPTLPAPVASPSPSTATTPTDGRTGATTQMALPAYFVGANSAAGDRFGLYREFVPTAVPMGATPAQKAQAAVAVAVNAQPFTNYEPYLQPWSATSVKSATVTPSLITITLSGPGAKGFTAAQTKLAVQQLVWTAQAAVGKGAIPVRFVVADGSQKLFGTYPTSQSYNRPAPDLQYEVLAPIWITSPARNQVFPAGTAVVATGQSCAFEGTTQWELKKSGKAFLHGVNTIASSGCPTRGTWTAKLGALPAGSYQFRMYEVSMKDGQVIAETSKPFTVR
jgi:Immunoglobulin-like domain of bacterial spore germination